MYGKTSITLLLAVFLVGCASTGFPPQTGEMTQMVPSEKRIEISLAPETYEVTEVEFHVDEESIPVNILSAAQNLMPGGEIEDCEIEFHGGKIFYEVTAKLEDREEEVMFTSDGRPYRWEIGVALDTVPLNTQNAALKAIEGAEVVKAEKILDGSRNLLEYHFKLEYLGNKYKAVVGIDDKVQVVFRETIGEIEVPVIFRKQ